MSRLFCLSPSLVLPFLLLALATPAAAGERADTPSDAESDSEESAESEPDDPVEVIVVTPGTFALMGKEGVSEQTLGSEDIKNMSWAEDVTRAVARLPGISSSDYSSKFTIRGGEANETLLTLDGMELYDPFHQRDYSGGLFSIVDIETIDGITLNTGGFGAESGNRLSGLLEMRTRRKSDGKRRSSVGLSLMNARGYSEGSFADGRGFYLASARRSMLDLAFRAIDLTETLPSFYDALGKVEYDLTPAHTLSFHVLHAGDRTAVRDYSEDGSFDRNDTNYQNTYGWLTLGSVYNSSLSSRTILYSSLLSHDRTGAFYKFELSDKGDFALTDRRDYSQVGLKQDWSWEPAGWLSVRSGFDVKHVAAAYDYFTEINEVRVDSAGALQNHSNTIDVQARPSGQQAGLYVTTRLQPFRRLFVEPGGRFDYAGYTGDRLWSPRLAAALVVTRRTVVRGAWGRYYQSQSINDLDVNHGNTAFGRAKRADHYILGVEQGFPLGISARVEAYQKDFRDIPAAWTNLRDHLEVFPEQRNDNALIVRNGATARGVELFLKYDSGGKFSAWFSYALAEAVDDVREIQFDGLLTRRTGKVPRLNNQRHTVYADMNYRLNDKWHFNVSWQYYEGWPRTTYTYDARTLPSGDLHFYQIHGEYNAAEYPAYHRLDLRVNRHFKTRLGRISTFVHLINVYNRENLKKFDLDASNDAGDPSLDPQGNYVPGRDDKYWLGFIPAVGASWAF